MTIYTYIHIHIYISIYLQDILRAGLFYLFYSNLSLSGLRERERVRSVLLTKSENKNERKWEIESQQKGG